MEEKQQFVTVRMSKQLAIESRVFASQKDWSRSEVIRQALVEYLRKGAKSGLPNHDDKNR